MEAFGPDVVNHCSEYSRTAVCDGAEALALSAHYCKYPCKGYNLSSAHGHGLHGVSTDVDPSPSCPSPPDCGPAHVTAYACGGGESG